MRLFLIALGMLLIYLGYKGVLEGLLMIPMGLGMATVNAGVLFLEDGRQGNLFVDPLVHRRTDKLMGVLQINWLQPVYTLTFSNGLIACLVFMGIGALLDVGYMMARPFQSMFIALCAELGTVVVFPLAHLFGLSLADSAAVATIGGADGPMILFTSLMLSEDLFVPITVVAYLYLGLTYGGYPYMIKLLVPRHIRGMKMPPEPCPRGHARAKRSSSASPPAPCSACCFRWPRRCSCRCSSASSCARAILGNIPSCSAVRCSTAPPSFSACCLGVLCEANTILNPGCAGPAGARHSGARPSPVWAGLPAVMFSTSPVERSSIR